MTLEPTHTGPPSAQQDRLQVPSTQGVEGRHHRRKVGVLGLFASFCQLLHRQKQNGKHTAQGSESQGLHQTDNEPLGAEVLAPKSAQRMLRRGVSEKYRSKKPPRSLHGMHVSDTNAETRTWIFQACAAEGSRSEFPPRNRWLCMSLRSAMKEGACGCLH